MRIFVLTFIFLVQLSLVHSIQTSCSSNLDCNYAGVCKDGSCICEKGWKGEKCESLSLGNSYPCGEGGLCYEDGQVTWGGGIIKGDDGKWHIYSALMANNCTLNSWLSNSRVVHAVADQPQGPYIESDIALDQIPVGWDNLTQHNPTIARAVDGTYLLYYMGSSYHTTSINCTKEEELQQGINPIALNQRIGLATSKSPYGPWKRHDTPILEPSASGWDDSFVTNPTVYTFNNGTVLMVYKARSKTVSGMFTGVAIADNYTGPYYRPTPSVPIKMATNCEDAGIYRSEEMGVFRFVVHCGCNYKSFWSLDGISWTSTTEEQAWCDVNYEGGGSEKLSRRERPQFVIIDGQPAFLTNGVQPTSRDHRQFTMVTEFN